jgi:hypothetical protein
LSCPKKRKFYDLEIGISRSENEPSHYDHDYSNIHQNHSHRYFIYLFFSAKRIMQGQLAFSYTFFKPMAVIFSMQPHLLTELDYQGNQGQ